MQIQVNSDHTVQGHEALAARIGAVVARALTRLSDHITRIEVHLSDENGAKSGPNDKRCVMEARLQGRQPVAVTHDAATLDQAVGGAAGKLGRLVERSLGRMHERRRRAAEPLQPGPRIPEA